RHYGCGCSARARCSSIASAPGWPRTRKIRRRCRVAEADRHAADPDLGPRWIEGPLVGRSGEAEAIELFRAATSLPAFSAVSSQRVWRRLSAAAPSRRWWRPAVIAGLVLA